MVVQQDEPGNTFYIMYEAAQAVAVALRCLQGKVDIIKDGSVVANLEALLGVQELADTCPRHILPRLLL